MLTPTKSPDALVIQSGIKQHDLVDQLAQIALVAGYCLAENLLRTAQRMNPLPVLHSVNPGFRSSPSVLWPRRSQ